MTNNCFNKFRFRRALVIVPLIATALAGTQATAEEVMFDPSLRDPSIVPQFDESASGFQMGAPFDDPVVLEGERGAGRNHFFINSSENVALIRLKKPHQLEMCAKGSHAAGGSAARGYPISVKWNDQSATIAPGNCVQLNAATITVRAASTLPRDTVLEGTVTIKR